MKKIPLILLCSLIGFLVYGGIAISKEVIAIKNGKGNHRVIVFPYEEEIKSGDIIFQTSKSNQSKAIQLATHSKYSHMHHFPLGLQILNKCPLLK